MRVLLLTPMPPSPTGLSATPVLLHALLRALRARHDVTLVTVAGPHPQDIEAARALRDSGLDVRAVPRSEATRAERASRWLRHTARWATSTLPARTIWFHRPEVQQAIDHAAGERRFDVVHAEDDAMGVYRLPAGVPSLLTEHEVRTPRRVRWLGWLGDENGPYRGLLDEIDENGPYRGLLDEIDWHRWERYHRAVWRRFDLLQALTERDAAVMRRIAPELAPRIRVNPFAVELPPLADPALEEEDTIVFTGAFLHPPNVDAARWLAGEILPRVRARRPGVRLRIVGSDPRGVVRGLGAPGVEITGWVPSIDAELARAAVVVAPVRTGGGQRMKVLHAMGAGKAVVTTPRGAEGLQVDDASSPPLVVAESADAIADATAGLLADPAQRRSLGARARAFVAARHGVDALGDRLDAAYAALLAGRGRSTA